MKQLFKKSAEGIKLTLGIISTTIFLSSPSVFAAADDKVHAFYADEHNISPKIPTGNRILEIDLENMYLVNTLDVPGIAGHHADSGFNSKIYGVPKGSNFVNVIDLRKDDKGNTSMALTNQIKLIHQPRSGDAYNPKYNVILMTAKNRPMGTFINVETDEIVGTIGENVDCKLTDGSRLLSHSDANSPQGANKYQCKHSDVGGNQISGHPYWLTTDYAAIVDRSNRQISVYKVWEEGGELKSHLVNHMKTRTSIHQIIPRDRDALPGDQKMHFYATEEGNQGSRYRYGIPHALLKMNLTDNGLQLVERMNLARSHGLSTFNAYHLKNGCRSIASDYSKSPASSRYEAFKSLFDRIGIPSFIDQETDVDFPVECLSAKLNGAHNADFTNTFSPDNKLLYIGSAGGFMQIVDVDSWKVVNTVDTGGLSGVKSGSGHTCFAPKKGLAIVTNHTAPYNTVIDMNTNKKITDIQLPFTRENIFTAVQSHTCYVDKAESNYYNFWTDGGVFYKIDLDSLEMVDSFYTGGIPIQGSYISLSNIKHASPDDAPAITPTPDDDTTISMGEIRTSLKGNRCASVWDADVGNGARTVLWDCASGGAPSQQYSFVPYGDFPDEYRVKAQHSGKCLAVAERGNGEIVQQWACENTAKNAIWKLEPQSEGYRLRNKLSNRCMAVWGGHTTNGTKLVQWDCADSQNMTFEIN